MNIITINKNNWSDGLKRLGASYRLFGPVKEKEVHNFKELKQGQLPDFNCLNSRIAPKWIVNPQTEVMFEYSLDEAQADHHILKEAPLGNGKTTVVPNFCPIVLIDDPHAHPAHEVLEARVGAHQVEVRIPSYVGYVVVVLLVSFLEHSITRSISPTRA